MPVRLSPGEAAEIPFEGDPGRALQAARSAFAARPLDVNVVSAEFRRKRLLVADMDSTMIRQECVDELAAEAGLRAKVAAITERAMRGEIAFAPALRERVLILKGLPAEVIGRVLARRIEIMPGARMLVATMRASGAHTALVSGGFTAFVEPIAARIGFDEARANRLLLDGDLLSGRLAEPIQSAEAKENALIELAGRLRLKPDETLAVGDGANDAGMIHRAGLGVGYRAKPALKAIAGAIIDHADLTGLLFLQGYSREEFVEGAADA